jgi:hypothetical protein
MEKNIVPIFRKESYDDVRFLPKGSESSMTSIIYDSKTAFISSSREAFGCIVESAEFSKLQRMQFQALWHTSKDSRKV